MDIFKILPTIDPVTIIDIGAMFIGDGTDPYEALLKRKAARIVGFEPNKEECDKLNARYQSSGDGYRRYLPYAIGDGTKKIFHITNTGMTSSLYAPNMGLLNKFQNLANLCQVVKLEMVDTVRIDDIAELAGSDYLKIDVQGAEKMVLENGKDLLKDIVVLQTEVEFVPLYKEQPLFADIDSILRENGFQFHKFAGLAGRTFRPLISNNNVNESLSQLLWADAVYVKDFMNLEILPESKLRKMAVILHEFYQSYDICHFVLATYDKICGDTLADKYRTEVLGVK